MGRTFILGIDSATLDVMDPLIKQGKLPHFKKIQEQGTWGMMTSTYPSRTPAAWVTLMTGINPGQHGIFDFWSSNYHAYDSGEKELVNSSNYAGKTFFDLLGRTVGKVAALFVPMTYPTWDINGAMVAGPPLAPDTSEALSFPKGFHQKKGIRHEIHFHPPSVKKGVDRGETIEDLLRMEEERVKVAEEMWKTGDYSCLMVVIEAIDIVQHRLWKYYKGSGESEFKDTIPQFYQKADELLGRLMLEMSDEDTLFVVSDHGMTGHPERCFNTNKWLSNQGWLRFSWNKAAWGKLVRSIRVMVHQILPESLYNPLKSRIKRSRKTLAKAVRMSDQSSVAVEWGKTQAFRVQMPEPALEGIMLNVKGRQPNGCVDPAQMRALGEMVRNALLKARCLETGKPFIRNVFFRDELYDGPYTKTMPDLIVEFMDGYQGGSELMAGEFSLTPKVNVDRLSGTHSPRGIFFAKGAPFRPGAEVRDMSIVDFAPTLLYSMGQSIPADMDGKVPEGIFRKEFREANRLELVEARGTNIPTYTVDFSSEETQQIEDRLRDLGYL